jgi:hyperosmotically inducible protein
MRFRRISLNTCLVKKTLFIAWSGAHCHRAFHVVTGPPALPVGAPSTGGADPMNTRTNLATLMLASVLSFGAASFASAQQATATPDNNKSKTDSEQPVTVAWITTKVKSELGITEDVKAMDINVDTKDGMVTLTGVVATNAEVQKAVAAAKTVKGVRSVDASGLKASSY